MTEHEDDDRMRRGWGWGGDGTGGRQRRGAMTEQGDGGREGGGEG